MLQVVRQTYGVNAETAGFKFMSASGTVTGIGTGDVTSSLISGQMISITLITGLEIGEFGEMEIFILHTPRFLSLLLTSW